VGKKKALYKRLGIEEYILFDPYGEYLKPSLQGFRLLKSGYQQIPLAEDGSLLSRTTGVRFQREGERLRLRDAASGEPILWPEEVEEARVRAEARAAEASAARDQAEERVRALEAELERLRKV